MLQVNQIAYCMRRNEITRVVIEGVSDKSCQVRTEASEAATIRKQDLYPTIQACAQALIDSAIEDYEFIKR
jgi:hypothetical protein